jgi:predicted MPP superfamily phosphohydrolase
VHHHEPSLARYHKALRDPRGPHVVRRDVIVPGLDPSHDGVRIAQLSDLHVGMLTSEKKIRRAIHRAAAERPDFTVLTGDYLCYSPKFLGRLRELIVELTDEIRAPAFAVLGNHDYWTDGEGVRKVFEHAGIDVLRNQHTQLSLRHAPFDIVGIDDAVTGHADPARAFRGAKHGHSRLVLTHVPSIADIATRFGPSLMLAGHTHGGHVNIPRITAGIAARLGNRYLAGFYAVGDSVLYVNRGIGSSSVPIRAGAPSEVTLLTLRAG